MPSWIVALSLLLGGLGFLGTDPLAAAVQVAQVPSFEALRLAGDWSGTMIGRAFYQYAHPDRSLTSVEALKRIHEGQGTRSQQKWPNFGPSPDVHFAYFIIDNPSPTPETLILESSFAIIDHLELYRVHGPGLMQVFRTGDQEAFSGRSFPSRNMNKELVLQPGRNAFMIRAWGDTCVQLPVKLWKTADFHERTSLESLIIGLLLGFHLIMVFYNLCLCVLIRQKVYLVYVTFVLANIIFLVSNLNLGQYLAYKMLGFETYLNSIQLTAIDVMIIFGLIFTRIYHEIDYRRTYRWLDWCVGLSIGLCILDRMVINGYSARASSIMVLGNALASMTLMILFGVLAVRSGFKPARYFLAGWAFYLAGSYGVATDFLGYTEPSEFGLWAQLLGGAIEVSLFSLALGHRYSEIQESLSHELQTRFHLMSDLSHRINNPLNHISTNVVLLQRDLARHESELMQLLRDSVDENSQETVQIVTDYENRLRCLRESAVSIEQATLKTSDTVRDIRVLSGVDGYHVESCSLEPLLAKCQQRITELFGHADQRTLVIRDIQKHETLYGNNVALQQSMVSIVVNLLKTDMLDGPLCVDLVPNNTLESRLVFSGQKAQTSALEPMLEQALVLSRHLLKPYSITIEIVEAGTLFKLIYHLPHARMVDAA